MNDRVTWLIPIKNGMPYLTETLASIESQTYTNWEVLVWDNGSTDGTLEELEKWIPHRLPGKIITGEPLTIGASLAKMVEICETEFCARIDADDVNLPERLEKQLAFLTDHPDVSVLSSWMYFVDEQGAETGLYTLPLNHDDIIHEMLVRNPMSHPAVIFRKSAILDSGNYQDIYTKWNGVNIEDYDLWLRVSRTHKLANLDIPLVKYRVHPNSTTQLAIKENRLEKAVNDCLCENALLTFGCSEHDMRLLRERKHPFAMRPILQIAKHLQKGHGGKIKERLRCPSFINSAKNLVSSKDKISRAFIRNLRHLFSDKPSLYQLLKSKTKKKEKRKNYTTEFPLHNPELSKWLVERKENYCTIDPSITFLGVNNPFDYVSIAPQCIIEHEFTLWISSDQGAEPIYSMGKRSYIGRNTFMGVFKPISIGECVLIGAYCYIISANHNYETRDIPIIDQGFVGDSITIEDDVWLGTHVVVLPGVTIGKGAIIGAHSLVNKDIPPYEIWGGVPAKFLKKRPL
jgi:acetyltransferase-like isoleucine patch superfamily enzyme/glycosyltransferase involved in cell wall biosynthesis